MAKVFKASGKHPSLSRNTTDIATELIRSAILEGRLKPGQRLKAGELAEELGISRTPIREALLVLQAEGAVSSSPNKGATVRTYDAKDIDDLYQLRAALEGHVARLAAKRATKQDLARCWQSCERLVRLHAIEDVGELVKENAVFHDGLLKIAGSQRLQGAMSLVDLPYLYRSLFWHSPDQKRASEHQHKEITKSLELHDPERAESLMKAHVLEARNFLIIELARASDPELPAPKPRRQARATAISL